MVPLGTLPKYKQNLSIVYRDGILYVKSYKTLVAKIREDTREVTALGYWSATTSKHVNYVAKYLNYKLIKSNNNERKLDKLRNR